MVTAGFQTNQVKNVQVRTGAVRTGQIRTDQIRTVQVRTYTWNSSVALLSPTCLHFYLVLKDSNPLYLFNSFQFVIPNFPPPPLIPPVKCYYLGQSNFPISELNLNCL